MFHHARTALAIFALGVSQLVACHEEPPGAYGMWKDAPDGGELPDLAAPTEDGGGGKEDGGLTLMCTPPIVGGEEGGYDFTRRTHGRLPDDEEGYIIPDPTCHSGFRWIGDDEESDFMTPGRDCMSCHPTVEINDGEDDDEAPGLSIAGTVYAVAKERDDCLGAAGARIRLTDAMGKLFELTSNRAGNFFREADRGIVHLPFSAEIEYQGRTRKMKTQQCNTSCNSCHTAAGDSGAPGRILLP
jgi:hypothetical protein